MAMKPLEIFINNERVKKTKDISKLIPLELLDSVEKTVLDPDIQKHGYNSVVDSLFSLLEEENTRYIDFTHNFDFIGRSKVWILPD